MAVAAAKRGVAEVASNLYQNLPARVRSAPAFRDDIPGATAASYHRLVTPLVEGEDFYYEGPCMVFTEKYLRLRGYCCESGCRHCPWDHRKSVRTDIPTEKPDSHTE